MMTPRVLLRRLQKFEQLRAEPRGAFCHKLQPQHPRRRAEVRAGGIQLGQRGGSCPASMLPTMTSVFSNVSHNPEIPTRNPIPKFETRFARGSWGSLRRSARGRR